MLPAGLTHLTFANENDENDAAGREPSILRMGSEFNQRVAAGVLPAGLKQLIFGEGFNQPVAVGVLPAGLTMLTFGHDFNQPLEAGTLPASLTQVTFGEGMLGRDVSFIPPGCSYTYVFNCCPRLQHKCRRRRRR